ncbi:hypothetical protein [Kurthia sibirica]|nr:hypothetical protein [Kurthia sibirica]GEK33577.1 hypothetical protein KSI01_11100 [Kurthia sibirica]
MPKKTGRKGHVTAEQEAQIISVIVNNLPKDAGFPVEMNRLAPLI